MIARIETLWTAFSDVARDERIPASSVADLVQTAKPIYHEIQRRRSLMKGCLVIGICGAQGSGKTTITSGLMRALETEDLAVAVLSLDDLYLSGTDRQRLADTVHPLLRTRGVPGTHDIKRGIAVVDSLGAGSGDQITALPSFDKATDEPRPRERDSLFHGRADVLLIEGWCVGARPQEPGELDRLVNALERDEDPDGIWRRYINAELGKHYHDFFARLDVLVLLRARCFEQALVWRSLQEQKLADNLRASGRSLEGLRVMNPQELERFVMHYERLTRHILKEMPAYADIVIDFDNDRRPTVRAP